MSKHEYSSNQYIAAHLADYCKSSVSRETGYYIREAKQYGESVLFKVGEVNCKVNIKGMIRNSPFYYYSQLEFSLDKQDSKQDTKNLSLMVKRSREGRISGNQKEVFKDFVLGVCKLANDYKKGLESKTI